MFQQIFRSWISDFHSIIYDGLITIKEKGRKLFLFLIYLLMVVVPVWIVGIVFLLYGLYLYLSQGDFLDAIFAGIASCLISVIFGLFGLIFLKRAI